MRRPALLLVLLALAAAVWRKRAAGADEKDLWHEATSAPDLR